MAWTVGDVLIQAREIIQDEGRYDTLGNLAAPQRHSDAKLLRYVNSALSEVRRLRPDAYIGDDTAGTIVNLDATIENISTDDPFPIEEQFFLSFVEFVAGMVGLGDDEYAQDGRAVNLINAFKINLVGTGATS